MQNQPEIERIVLHSRAVENRGGKGEVHMIWVMQCKEL
jgi:hypothetical protein